MTSKIILQNVNSDKNEFIEVNYGKIYFFSLLNGELATSFIESLKLRTAIYGIKIYEDFSTINDIEIAFPRLSYLLSYPNVSNYLKNNTSLTKQEIEYFIFSNELNGKDLIVSLGYSDRYLIALKIFLLQNNCKNIIINFNNLDFNGMYKVYNLIKLFINEYCFLLICNKDYANELIENLNIEVPFTLIEL